MKRRNACRCHASNSTNILPSRYRLQGCQDRNGEEINPSCNTIRIPRVKNSMKANILTVVLFPVASRLFNNGCLVFPFLVIMDRIYSAANDIAERIPFKRNFLAVSDEEDKAGGKVWAITSFH